MNTILLRGGQVIGVLGLLLMAFSVTVRLSGRFVIGGFETGSLLQAGIATVAAGCFLLLFVLVQRGR